MSEAANLNKIADLEGRVIVLRGLLRRLEWPFEFNQCGICHDLIYDGHADDCELDKELGDE